MSNADDVARLREIKRLLDRIQQLPHIAGLPEGGPPPRTLRLRSGGTLQPCVTTATGQARAAPQGLQARLAEDASDTVVTYPRLVHRTATGTLGRAAYGLGPPHPDDTRGDADDVASEPMAARVGPPPLVPPAPVLEARGGADQDADGSAARLPEHYEDRLPSHLDAHRDDQPEDRYDFRPPPMAGALVPARRQVSVGVSPWVFVTATAVNTMIAAVLAIVITLGVTRREPAPAEGDTVGPIIARPAAEPQPTPPPPRAVELLQVGSAAGPLQLEALKPARLPLQVRPEAAADESYILLLRGLPANAVLSGASRMGADSWLLPPGALQRLELIVPEWSASVFEVDVELRSTTGAVVAQSKLWLAIPPPPTPEAVKLDDRAIKELVRSGDSLLGRGDVAAARAIYERAAALGSAQAALAMGSTYDPRRLWSLGVFGMVGNKERAKHWYQRAQELGHPEARARIAALREK